MNRKILLTAIAVAVSVTIATASDGTPSGGAGSTLNASQQVIVTRYYNQSGYEYASRIKRFHTTYVTFDFYSPVYTETYWYRYTPYTWGVSIYDDWHYYGAGATGYAWRSGFGGSYWWGYDTWRNYDPWMGYGWNSWNSPGVSYSVNYYLGRPHYHYPVAYNNWNNHYYRNYNRPVTVINNNTYNYYYGSEKRNSYQGSSSGYNPTNPNTSGRRAGYTSTGGRSSGSGTAPATTAGGGTETGTQTGSQGRTQTGTRTGTRSTQTGTQGRTQTGTQGRTQTGTRTGTRSTQTGSQGNQQTTTQTGNQGENTGTDEATGEKEKSNNGLRMGQHRRGVADPADPADNGLPRTNNPNLNDRTDPGREQGNASRSTGTNSPPASADRAPAGGTQQNKVQSTVRTTSQRRETVMRQGSPSGTTAPKETTTRQGREKKTEKASEATTTTKETKKTASPAPKRR